MGKLLNKLLLKLGNKEEKVLPWTDRDLIAACMNQAGSDRNLTLGWALVHSTDASHIHRGIAMLEAALDLLGSSSNDIVRRREILYSLAIGHFRSRNYSRSQFLVDKALEISPDFYQALELRKLIAQKKAGDTISGGFSPEAAGLFATALCSSRGGALLW